MAADTITLPGLIDPHVHLREPGQTHKEDFYTGSSAALAGGYTAVFDMPNNQNLITTEKLLDEKIALAKNKVVCDIGFFFGTLGDNFKEFSKIYDKSIGLKVYLNVTTGAYTIDRQKLAEIYKNWQSDKPIFLHSEEDVSDIVLTTLNQYTKLTHICHVSSKKELSFVMRAKDAGLPITCGVTPHHLFLNKDDKNRLGSLAHMKPFLKSKADQKFLWDHLDAIDVIESDHAPHTLAEKDEDTPPFGVPGLETTLPLLLTAESMGKITKKQIVEKLHENPAKILSIKPDPKTKIEVSLEEYEIQNKNLKTKCGWSPFAGKKVIGKVNKVFLNGKLVFENGNVLSKPGSGEIIS